MGILTFKGGVHPYDGKELSKNSPVVKYLPKGDMVYPLSQHIGAPAAAIVQKGDHVLEDRRSQMLRGLSHHRSIRLFPVR